MFAALLASLLYSISAVAGSRLSRILGGVEANFFRITLATFLLGLYAHSLGAGFSGKALPFFLLSGLIGFGIGDLALYQALPRIGSRLCMILVHCLAAPVGALFEWLWLGTTLSAFQVSCGVVILLGVAVALAPSEHPHIPRTVLLAGIAFGVVAALGQATGSVVSRKAYDVARAAGQSIDGISAAYQRIWGGVVFAALSYLAYRWRLSDRERAPLFSDRLGRAWKWLLLNGMVGPALGVSCFQWALSTTPTGIVLALVALTPLIIIPLARKFENEKPGARSLIGGAIAVLGVIGLRLSMK